MPFKDGQVRVSQSSSVFLPYALTKDVHHEDNIIIQTGLTLSRKKKKSRLHLSGIYLFLSFPLWAQMFI